MTHRPSVLTSLCGPMLAVVVAALLVSNMAMAGPLRDRLFGHKEAATQIDDEGADEGKAKLPAGVRVLRDQAYGSDPLQRFDVYLPAHASNAPIIVMVHGGAWAFGDKSNGRVVDAKLARWVPRGVVFVSVNYRMLPDTPPLAQAGDVARALVAVQQRAAEWGGDRNKVVLMGHSAGAHLVSLVSAQPALLEPGAARWLGTVSLDSAAFDVTALMQGRHLGLYDRAFGARPADWDAASPTRVLASAPPPFLAVCSSRRSDSCPQAEHFVARAAAFGGRASVLREDLSHGDINATLGDASAYTAAVEDFLRSLDPALAAALR